ncbi:MAG: allophanate hydrolase, partial [Piscirickettsiaceae bacterium]|nr:allophanate hydrolase [Piscirickettsiaceae bacterium]
LFGQTYNIGKESDRTGCRLEGQSIENTPATMISEGMAYGSVEITTAGLPIILLKDAPTIGGYPKIGTVLSLDLAKLAQRQPGCEVSFELIDIETAQQLRREFNQFFE